MSVNEFLMNARHDDRLRTAAQSRLAEQVRQARAAERGGEPAPRPARRRLRVWWRRVPA
jgi:hypothetical protein